MKLFTTAAAILAATTITASAMTGASIVKSEVQALGIDATFVDALSDADFIKLKSALHGGDDADIRQAVRSLANG